MYTMHVIVFEKRPLQMKSSVLAVLKIKFYLSRIAVSKLRVLLALEQLSCSPGASHPILFNDANLFNNYR